MRGLWEALVSLRTTAALIAALGALLLVNVAVPQASADPEAYARALRGGAVARFILRTLGLGDLSTSAIFLATLGLFFANLTAVLIDRMRATARRLRRTAPSPVQLDAMLRDADSIPIAEGARGKVLERARGVLETFGYVTMPVAGNSVWAVRHRLALLGFPIFHAAFYVMAAGGTMLFLTREVVDVAAAEGQTVSSTSGVQGRVPPLGRSDPVELTVERVDLQLADGKTTELAASLRLSGDAGGGRVSRINRPAVWDDLTVLVARAGIAPVLWVQDERGFTLDRVTVIVARGQGLPTRVRLGGAPVEAIIEPIGMGRGFPEREKLPTTPLHVSLTLDGSMRFDGSLRAGEAVDLGEVTVRLEEVRYWVGLALVRERGGGWLVAGFLLSIVGIAWRMVWRRTEIGLALDGDHLRITGRTEFFPRRFREELEQVKEIIRNEIEGGGRR